MRILGLHARKSNIKPKVKPQVLTRCGQDVSLLNKQAINVPEDWGKDG